MNQVATANNNTSLNFPISDFLNLLLRYTMLQAQCDNEQFLECLQTWTALCDVLITARSQHQSVPQQYVRSNSIDLYSRYIELLLSLVGELMSRIQFATNSNVLQSLSTETTTDKPQSDQDDYIEAVIECMAKVGELDNDSVIASLYNILVNQFSEIKKFESIFGMLQPGQLPRELVISLKDCGITLRCIQRFAEFFLLSLSQGSANKINMALELEKLILEMLVVLQASKLYRFAEFEKLYAILVYHHN